MRGSVCGAGVLGAGVLLRTHQLYTAIELIRQAFVNLTIDNRNRKTSE